MRITGPIVALSVLLGFPGQGRAQAIDLLLVLAADVSRSIDETEFTLQRKGYSAAITDPRVLAAIRGGAAGSIAICFIEWSGAGEQNVVTDWTVIRDEEDAGGFAAAILAAPRSFIGRTSISGAIDFAMERLAAAQRRADALLSRRIGLWRRPRLAVERSHGCRAPAS